MRQFSAERGPRVSVQPALALLVHARQALRVPVFSERRAQELSAQPGALPFEQLAPAVQQVAFVLPRGAFLELSVSAAWVLSALLQDQTHLAAQSSADFFAEKPWQQERGWGSGSPPDRKNRSSF